MNYRSGGDPFATTAVYGINSTDMVVGQVTGIGGFVQTGGTFSFIEFPGTSSFDTTPRGIAADGTVVGCFATSRMSPFLRGPRGNFLEMIIPDAQRACALAISNPAGKIVGEFQDTSGVWHGFVYDYVSDLARTVVGVPTARTVRVQVVDHPGATRTQLTGINGEGKIAGWADLNNGRTVSFIGTARP